MTFFATMARMVFDSLPWAIVLYFPLFLLVVAVLLYRRRAVERRVLGRCAMPFWRELTGDALSGIAAGYAGSLLLFYLGITIKTEGFAFVVLLAFLLMLLDLRYLCLAYAGGLLSLISLATGQPKLHIPGLLALVAVLHMIESALILSDGHRGALPVYLKRPEGTVGGYLLQRVWPVPLLALGMIATTGQEALVYFKEPSWWPLVPLVSTGLAAGLAFSPIPVAAALGYGDLALTAGPRAKAVRTAALLGFYSLLLLSMAIAAARWQLVAWIAAVFTPVGHELVLYAARQRELRGRPAFSRSSDGLVVLAVLPGSRAAKAGLRAGDTIASVNGQPVRTKGELQTRLGDSPVLTSLALAARAGRPARTVEFKGGAGQLGLVMAPELDEPAQVEVGPWRFLPGRRAPL